MKQELLEKSILGTMLEDNYLIKESQLKPEMFLMQAHQTIFRLMQQLVFEEKVVDFVTLSASFEEVAHIGAQYVMELGRYANLVKFDRYVAVLREMWREQQKGRILVQAAEGDWGIGQIIQQLDETQLEADVRETGITKLLLEFVNRPFEEVQYPGLVVPHIADLAKLLDGFRPGELTIIAGRPSMGKTDVMNNLAVYAGWNGHLPIIFSLEMSERTLVERLIATTGNYARLKMRNPKVHLTPGQVKTWMPTLDRLNKANMQIDDRVSLTIAQIRSQARRIIRQHAGCTPILFVDYLQIIQTESDEYSAQALGKVSRGLKQMAKELNCPVVCLSQLNRNVEGRGVKRPMMSDLRDSGSIEQDADVIILLYRASYYEDVPAEQANVLELIVAKNRNGPTGTAYATYNQKTGHIVTRGD